MRPTTPSPLVFVTGADGGIGSAAVAALKERGAHAIGFVRVDADLSSPDEIGRLANRALKEHGRADWAVYAHGFLDAETGLGKQREEDIAATFDINTLSIIYLTRHLLPHLQRGSIFVSSTAGLSPNGQYAAYSASKAAVNAFAEAIAKTRPDLISIALCPGPTNTAMRRKIDPNAVSAQSPEIVAEAIADIVMGVSPYKNGDTVVVRSGEISLHSMR